MNKVCQYLRPLDCLQIGCIAAVALWFVIVLGLPLTELVAKALLDEHGNFAGLANFVSYFETPALVTSLWNTIYISAMTTLIAVTLALFYAYALVRTAIQGKTVFKYIAMLPLYAPSMLQGIALVYLFGNKGLITTGFFGLLPGFNIQLYGPVGIILSEVIFTFPQVLMIFLVAFAVTDYRLYEAAEMLGAGSVRKFFTVTLPSVKYALISSVFISFTASFVDFGAPKVVGGQYNVLATDLYKQVIGQQNLAMGATVGILLLIPSVVSFAVDRILQRKQTGTIGSASAPYRVKPNKLRDWLYFSYCLIIAGSIMAVTAAIVLASMVKVWPYDLSFTLQHFTFKHVAADGLAPFWNSLIIALITAVAGTILVFVSAYLAEKTRFLAPLKQFNYFMSILPLALPGLVIGLAYIFFFNKPQIVIPLTGVALANPFHFLYGTFAMLVLANIVHYYSVPFVTATAALKKLDREFEAVAESMAVPFYRTFLTVTVPMCLASILEIAGYFFVTAMTTVSAVVFLYAPEWKPAAVTIINMEDAGDVAPAAAMAALILAANLAAQMIYSRATRRTRERMQAWQQNKRS